MQGNLAKWDKYLALLRQLPSEEAREVGNLYPAYCDRDTTCDGDALERAYSEVAGSQGRHPMNGAEEYEDIIAGEVAYQKAQER